MNASTDVVLWLESPEGEAWSRSRHAPICPFLVGIKGEVDFESIIWWFDSPGWVSRVLDEYREAENAS